MYECLEDNFRTSSFDGPALASASACVFVAGSIICDVVEVVAGLFDLESEMQA